MIQVCLISSSMPKAPRYFAGALLLFSMFFSMLASSVDVVVSENDDRQYRYLQLENKMQVLLISDATAEKSAAAMDVYVGSNQNPRDREGLAHFLEHMLFLGTEKYPDAGEYQQFISEHGGNHNAYTSSDNTNYFFDVDSNHLEATLDRFAQFFTSPLFTAEYVDRERHAVESEYRLKIKNEARRRGDVLSEIVNQDHPLSLFRTGSLTTLDDREDDSVRDALLKFYREYYSANIMSLVVLGKEPLDELESMTVKRFKHVVNNDVVIIAKAVPLFEKDFLPAKISIKPLKEERLLTLSFPLPDTTAYYQKKPLHYIGNILAHEGEGSLLSFLKKYGWAEGLSAGGGNHTRFDGSFDVNIQLTERGANAVDQIVALTFHVIQELDKKAVKEWRFDEDKKLADIAFRFQEKGDAMNTVSALASRLHQYAPEDVLRGGYMFTEFDPSLIKRFLSYLTPENLLLTLSAPNVTVDKISSWYQTPYSVASMKALQPFIIDKYSRQLYFPPENPFIPQRLTVKAGSLLNDSKLAASSVPEKIVNDENYEVWFKQDSEFKIPRASISLRLKLPMAAQSARTAAMNKLFVALVNDSLNEFAYPASLAGLYFSVQANSRGIDVSIDGYNDRQGLLLSRILETMRKARFDEARFESVKVELLRGWDNADKAPPYQQLAREVAVVAFAPLWEQKSLRDALEPISLADFNEFSADLLNNAQAQTLFYGNLYRQEALKLSALIENQLLFKEGEVSLPQAQVVKFEATGVKPKPSKLRQLLVDHKDTAAILYLQGLNDSIEDKAKMLLLRQVVESPFYTRLRTEKQLGYVVMASGMPLKKVPGTIFVVQSPVADGGELIAEIGGFVDNFAALIPKDLGTFKLAVKNSLLQQPKSLSQQSSRYWDDILYGFEGFDRRQQLAKAVDSLSTEDLERYYAAIIKPERRLWLLSSALGESLLKQVDMVKNPSEFKRESVVYSYR